MRIGYTSHSPFPSAHTSTQQIFWTLREIARLGSAARLTVPGGPAAPGSWRTAIGRYYANDENGLPDLFGIEASGGERHGWLNELRFDLQAPARFRAADCDFVWTRDYVAAAALVRAGRPTVFETYRVDLATRLRFAAWRRLVLRSPHLRGAIVHSHLAGRALAAAGLDEAKCLVAHNGFAPSLMEPRLDRESARGRLALPLERFVVVYTGHVGPHKGLDAMVRLAAAVPEADFLVVGGEEGSSEVGRLEALAARASARNIRVRPRVAPSGIAPYLYAADCLLIPPAPARQRLRRTVLPIKVFSYLAAGRAILAPGLPDIEEVLTDGVTARLVPAGDEASAVAALRALMTQPGLRSALAEGALRASAGFTWEARARRILPFLERRMRAA